MLDLEELEKKDKLKTKVLKYIMYKKRTEQEVRKKFSDIEDYDLLDEVIDDLKENRYINDDSYIERAISEFINLKNMSLKELKYKLASKGLNKDLVDDYFYNNAEKLEEYEINSAKSLINKKSNGMEEQEIIQFLLKRGYKMDSIKKAISMLND